MYLKAFTIENFKSFERVTFSFHKKANILTGKNNSGKTTALEAIALWQECFRTLLAKAKQSREGKKPTPYAKGDYILGNTQTRYFPFEQINSVRSPNFEDIFYQRDKTKSILLQATLCNDAGEELSVPFRIRASNLNYDITAEGFTKEHYRLFNRFFEYFPHPIALSYASPIAAVLPREKFTTVPNIREAITERNAVSVLRNRLSFVYNSATRNPQNYANFLRDLNYIIFGGNNRQGIQFFEKTKATDDSQAIFTYTLGDGDTEKDIALLGSGTLQVMEILLNLYYKDRESDFNIVLLDEPDSHIHRDIQARLLGVIHEMRNAQSFITTHNEAFIRSASIDTLFHLDGAPKAHYKAIQYTPSPDLSPRFKGIYPSPTDTLMRDIGQANGLDFINALEAHRIIFVEGQDDAKRIKLLMRLYDPNDTKKYLFWVLGGVSHIFNSTGLLAYKKLFEQIQNERTLWEKSYLTMDRGFLIDEHHETLKQKIRDKFKLPVYIGYAYTFESTLLTNLAKLSQILAKWLLEKNIYQDALTLHDALEGAHRKLVDVCREKYLNDSAKREETTNTYKGYKAAIEKCLEDLGDKQGLGKGNDINLVFAYEEHLKNAIRGQELYKIARKEDVAWLVQEAFRACDISVEVDIERHFIEWLACANRQTRYESWDFVRELLA